MREVAQKFMSAPLFNFEDLKLSTNDIIAVLKDIVNTTSGPLPILDPHATEVPSNTSRVVNGVRNLVTSFNMVKISGLSYL